MIDLDHEKKKLELQKLKTAKFEMEYKIKERQADIERLTENLKKQDEKIEELEQKLKGEDLEDG